MLSIIEGSSDCGGFQVAVAAVVVAAAAAGTLGAVTASTAAAGVLAVSSAVPLVSLEVQSREMCPAMPHL